VVVGTGLDVPDLAVTVGAIPAIVVSRASTLLEFIVPQTASPGPVRVGTVVLPFTLAPDAIYVKVATIVASDPAHDILKEPMGVAVLASGVVFIADRLHHQIKQVTPAGQVSTISGFKEPRGVAYDATRNILYVADSGNHLIRKIAPDGSASTFAGSGRPDDSDGSASQASFKQPSGIAIDSMGNLYVADTGNNKIKAITPSGLVQTIAGATPEGFANGPALQALFKQPEGIAVNASGVLYIADTQNNVIRKLENGVVSTIAGTGHGGVVDGPPDLAEFMQPSGISLDEGGNLWIADTGNEAIRRIGQTVTTIGTGKPGYVDGALAASQWKQPAGLAVEGGVWIGDTKNDALRVIYPSLAFSDLYPRSGDPGGGTTVRIFGTGFVPGAMTVAFGTSQSTSITYVSSTELLVLTPSAPIGRVDVTVTSPAGTMTLRDAFRYEPPFVSILVSPAGATLDPGQDLQFTAQGVASDNSVTDITTRVTWMSSAQGVAMIAPSGMARAVAPGTTTITGTLGSLLRSVLLNIANPEPLPPDPASVAPRLDPTLVPAFADEIRFLYSGPNAIQTGVAPGAIDDRRANVVRGTLRTLAGQSLPGVYVTAAGHPEYGQTLTRADGVFDFVINGGGTLSLQFAKKDFIGAQRAVTSLWGQQVTMADVILIAYDSQVTAVTMAETSIQVAQANVVTDGDGSRRATVIVPASTTAVLVFPDGSTQPAQILHVRATEFSVGPNGPKAMPAALPPHSAYTYCVELSADEAVALRADVQFSKPLPFYVENFLGFAVGTIVPVGYYDRQIGAWVPSDNGVVLKIVSITNGTADIDLNGDGSPESAAALATVGIDAAEQQKVATLYTTGQTLWRVPVTHFSTWDGNWLTSPIEITPGDAVTPHQPQPATNPDPSSQDASGPACGASIVNCYSATVYESIPITGTPFSLEYDSTRIAPAQNSMTISLSGATVPASLKRIELSINIAGRSQSSSFPPQPNLALDFTWDGVDVYGRRTQGARDAGVVLTYVYDSIYVFPFPIGRAWDQIGYEPTGVRGRTESRLSQAFSVRLGHFTTENAGFGGWAFSAQQFYDGRAGTIYEAGGAQRSGDPGQTDQLALSTVAGNTQFGFSGDGGPATGATLRAPNFIAVGADGSLYICDSNFSGGCRRIRRVDGRSGTIQTIAGNGQIGFTADGLQALGNPISASQLAAGPDGSLYFVDGFRVRRIVDGLLTTIAGNGTAGSFSLPPDGASATQTAITPRALAVRGDGTVYISLPAGVIRVAHDGLIMNHVALPFITGLAVDSQGELYAVDTFSVFKIGLRGSQIIGGLPRGSSGHDLQDGQLATSGSLSTPAMVTVASDGTVLVSETGLAPRVRAIGTDGIATTLIGTGRFPRYAIPEEGLLARAAPVGPWGIAVSPDGSVYVLDQQLSLVRRAAGVFPASHPGVTAIPSPDALAAYVFENGRHASTVDALTGVTLLSLGYDPNGYLTTLTDLDGNMTRIDRAGDGSPTAIIAPGGQQTVLQTFAGRLTGIVNPANETYEIAYNAAGLMSDLTDPRRGMHHLTYDTRGLVTRDEGPDGSYFTLSRNGLGQSYTVTRTTAEGHDHLYKVQLAADMAATREHDFSDGTSVKFTFAAATTTATSSDGSTQTTTDSPDPRFGMAAPFFGSGTLTGGGKTASVSSTRAVTRDPSNPFRVASLTETTAFNGRRWTSVYDGSSRTIHITTPAGRSVVSTLDEKGRLASLSRLGVADANFAYDSFGRLSQLQQGSRNVTLAYNNKHELIGITDPLRRSVHYDYDAAGRVISENLPNGSVIGFAYDMAGNLTSLTPPGRPNHLFSYTPADLVSTYTPPAVSSGGVTRYNYNRDRQLTMIERPDGKAVSLAYDSAGRLGSLTLLRGSYSFTYNTAGQISRMTDPDGGELEYAYSGPLLMSTTWKGPVIGSISFGYDNDFQLTSETAAGSSVAYSYDADGLLINAGLLSLSRDAQNGLLTGSKLGVISDTWSYNSFGEPASYSAASLFAQQYGRDDGGRITQKSETVMGETHTYLYGYDTAGRLSGVTRDGANVSSYAYDSNGNRLPGTYDTQDRMLAYGGATYTYTGNGELASKTDGSGTTTYEYDELGSLTKVSLPTGKVIEYVIDGENRRVGKKIAGILVRQWLYGDALRIVAELDGTGAVISRFVYGRSANLPDYIIRSGVTYRIISDHLGSPRVIADSATGSVAQRMDFDEFGNVVLDTNPGFTPFGFAGGLFDADTNLVRFGARDYDSRAGRWTTKDPIRFAGRDASFYDYVFADPVNLVDPSGTDIWLEGPVAPEPQGHLSLNVGDPNGDYDSYSFGVNDQLPGFFPGEVYRDISKGGAFEPGYYLKTTPEEDAIARASLESIVGHRAPYRAGRTCRTFSRDNFWRLREQLHLGRHARPPYRAPNPNMLPSTVPRKFRSTVQ
jgi:RHS repeat-associated protein